MVLEATVICIDNSEYSRNGDYVPSRLDVQCDAANIICGTKANSNPENSVGLITSAGDRVIVHVTPTQDVGKILQGFHDIAPEGEADIIRAVQTAQLALKHRMNKIQKQRIVLFVGSPIKASERQLEKLGRVLKKNNIALGETQLNAEKLTKLHNTVNSSHTSHLVECPVETTKILSDVLVMSPIVRDSNTGTLNALPTTHLVGFDGQEGSINPDIGVDPRIDPDLYMALQISLLEERERQSRTEGLTESLAPPNGVPTLTAEQSGPDAAFDGNPASDHTVAAAQIQSMEGIDDELRQALLLSLEDFYQPTEPSNQPNSESTINPPTDSADTHMVSVGFVQGDDVGIVIPPESSENTMIIPSSVISVVEEQRPTEILLPQTQKSTHSQIGECQATSSARIQADDKPEKTDDAVSHDQKTETTPSTSKDHRHQDEEYKP